MRMSVLAQVDHELRFHGRISLGVLILSLLPAQAGQAQQQTAAVANPAEPAGELVVTGSRITREILDLPTPVNVVSAQSLLANNGQFDIGRALAQQPAVGFSGSMQQNQQSGAAGTRGESSGGLAVVDLRSLGSNCTLVLINGKRRVAGSTDSAAVDLNSLDINLIERVEIITGGASAIYGSDAMSGVVNVIMRDDFEGLRLTANGSQPARGSEGRTYSGSLVAGLNFSDKRGNITVAADYTKIREITPAQADMRNNVYMINPASTGIADGIPDRILVPNAESYRFSGYGAVGTRGDTRTLGALYFNDDGTARPAPANGVQRWQPVRHLCDPVRFALFPLR
jgi:outer membrane cobalamin receptor